MGEVTLPSDIPDLRARNRTFWRRSIGSGCRSAAKRTARPTIPQRRLLLNRWAKDARNSMGFLPQPRRRTFDQRLDPRLSTGLRRRSWRRYLRLGDGKLLSLGWIETSVELVAEALGFCCFG